MRNITVNNREFELFIPEKDIIAGIENIAQAILRDIEEDENPLFVCTLNGSFMFAAELMKRIDQPFEIAFSAYSSYKGTTSTGEITEVVPIKSDIKGRTVILMEDIIDTGATMSFLIDKLSKREPKRILLATMLFKPKALRCNLIPDYVGIEIPNDFIVGYGLDYDQKGRGLKDIYKIKE